MDNNFESAPLSLEELRQMLREVEARAEKAEARAEKAERELEAVITAINNGYRIGAITIRDPKFILPGIKISGWYRTVKEE